jgi:hypothetical protein
MSIGREISSEYARSTTGSTGVLVHCICHDQPIKLSSRDELVFTHDSHAFQCCALCVKGQTFAPQKYKSFKSACKLLHLDIMFKFLLVLLVAVEIVASGLDVQQHSASPEDLNNADASVTSRQLKTLPTIAKLLDDNTSFDTLSAALKAAGLDATLKGAGPFTVLAPTDKVRLSSTLIQFMTWSRSSSHVVSASFSTRLSPNSGMPLFRLFSMILTLFLTFSCTTSSAGKSSDGIFEMT